jgi:hypothetical protein
VSAGISNTDERQFLLLAIRLLVVTVGKNAGPDVGAVWHTVIAESRDDGGRTAPERVLRILKFATSEFPPIGVKGQNSYRISAIHRDGHGELYPPSFGRTQRNRELVARYSSVNLLEHPAKLHFNLVHGTLRAGVCDLKNDCLLRRAESVVQAYSGNADFNLSNRGDR